MRRANVESSAGTRGAAFSKANRCIIDEPPPRGGIKYRIGVAKRDVEKKAREEKTRRGRGV